MASINWTNVTDISQIPGLANTATDGTFWTGITYMIWAVLFLITLVFGLEVALLVASFVTLILSLLMLYAGLIGLTHVIVFVAIIIFTFLYIIWSSSKNK